MPKLATLTVSRQGFGAMGLSSAYGAADDAESIRTLHRAIDLGITFFDTATGYGAGHNETLLGKAIADRRDGLVIASKFTHRAGGSDAPPIKARDAVEASLGRLGLDFIDLYHLHRVDLQIPIEESVGELGRQRDEGKIGGVGVSEATADGLRRANAAYPVTALQSEYSLWTRGVEAEILPTARELGVGFVSLQPARPRLPGRRRGHRPQGSSPPAPPLPARGRRRQQPQARHHRAGGGPAGAPQSPR
jgi:aryl-alcohol dehydrogenase-like predicted oxidoreductase